MWVHLHMSSFYPHSNALPASVLPFSFPVNNLSSDNIPRIGAIFYSNKLAPGLLSDVLLGHRACPRAGLVLGAAWQWASLRLAGGELGAGPGSRYSPGEGVGSSGARVDGIRAEGACWEQAARN